jgi:hypothetical protein
VAVPGCNQAKREDTAPLLNRLRDRENREGGISTERVEVRVVPGYLDQVRIQPQGFREQCQYLVSLPSHRIGRGQVVEVESIAAHGREQVLLTQNVDKRLFESSALKRQRAAD